MRLCFSSYLSSCRAVSAILASRGQPLTCLCVGTCLALSWASGNLCCCVHRDLVGVRRERPLPLPGLLQGRGSCCCSRRRHLCRAASDTKGSGRGLGGKQLGVGRRQPHTCCVLPLRGPMVSPSLAAAGGFPDNAALTPESGGSYHVVCISSCSRTT